MLIRSNKLTPQVMIVMQIKIIEINPTYRPILNEESKLSLGMSSPPAIKSAEKIASALLVYKNPLASRFFICGTFRPLARGSFIAFLSVVLCDRNMIVKATRPTEVKHAY